MRCELLTRYVYIFCVMSRCVSYICVTPCQRASGRVSVTPCYQSLSFSQACICHIWIVTGAVFCPAPVRLTGVSVAPDSSTRHTRCPAVSHEVTLAALPYLTKSHSLPCRTSRSHTRCPAMYLTKSHSLPCRVSRSHEARGTNFISTAP